MGNMGQLNFTQAAVQSTAFRVPCMQRQVAPARAAALSIRPSAVASETMHLPATQ
jgi:hypothetical protein